ncbi:MAG TPA: 2Fe-2S iron-sulfur cluster-binding protein, partial [Spirochaetota bacterium]|nr:2Fe-2S iron-sulfur cluster-binding protein [Spirochaetota bacterium]
MDESVTVVFHPLNKVASVPKKSSVLDAIREAGIQFESIYGGKGECKKCKIVHTRGDCTAGSPESTRGLSKDELQQHVCLACQTFLLGDCEFIIPVESRIDTPKILLGICKDEAMGSPSVIKYRVGFDPGTLPLVGGRRSLRLLEYTGKRPQITSDFYHTLTSARSPCTATISDSAGYPEIIAIEPGDTTASTYGLAVDLGTTTVVGMLFNLADTNFCAQASTLNRQITYGEELVTRLAFAREPGGLEKMQLAAVESINAVLIQLTTSKGIESTSIQDICLAGNTVMQYLFYGRNPRGLEMADAVVD